LGPIIAANLAKLSDPELQSGIAGIAAKGQKTG